MILFFFRRYNDLDHIVPIVYKMVSDGYNDIALLSMSNHFNIYDDFRLNFLRNEFNIDIQYLIKYKNKNIIENIVSTAICCSTKLFVNDKTNKRILTILKHIFKNSHKFIYKIASKLKVENKVFKKIFNDEWCEAFIKSISARCLVFDSAMHKKLYNYKSLRRAAKKQNIPVIYVPHGLPLIRMMPEHAKKVFDTLHDSEPNYVIVPHDDNAREHYEHGFDNSRVLALGSARFCSEWKDILDKITPKQDLPIREKEKLKVVYFARTPGRCGEYFDIIRDTLHQLADLEFVELIIKPHTRSNKLEFPELAQKVFIGTDIHSLNLIKWADVILGTISSITIDAFLEYKPFIFIEYFMYGDNSFRYDYLFNGGYTTCKNYNELHRELLNIFKNNLNARLNRQKILNKLVYNNSKVNDVLLEYKQFIKNNSLQG